MKAVTGPCQVVGDGMIKKATCVNQGDLLAKETEFLDIVPKSRVSRSQSAHSSEEVS